MIEFKAWPKTPRLFRDMIVTEKLDGTNAAVQIHRVEEGAGLSTTRIVVADGGAVYAVAAQSRKRLITPEADNFGFARWVWDNAPALVRALGEGVHYGEWWGSGIQRGYGLPKGEKRFSLFNVSRYTESVEDGDSVPAGLGVVPVLYEGPFDTAAVVQVLDRLRTDGSYAAPFSNPEGIIVFHTASNGVYKVTIEDDEKPKGQS